MSVPSILVALVLAAASAGCSAAPSARAAARLVEGGNVMVADGDGWRALEPGDRVPGGARVRTGLDTARLELDGGAVWLAPSAVVTFDGDVVAVERGEVMVHSDGGLRTVWDAVTIDGDAVYRLVQGASPRVGVYEGSARVRRPAEERAIAPLRQIGLGARRLAAEPDPLYYSDEDGWDRELLPRAIAFDEEVARLARGIDREYGTAPQPAEFYDAFVAVPPETVSVLAATARRRVPGGAFGPPSDALVTLFVAAALSEGGGATLEEAVRRVAERRDEGARWGLVAVELGVDPGALAAAVDLGRERRETPPPGSGPGGAGTPSAPPGGPGPAGPEDPGGPGPGPGPGDPDDPGGPGDPDEPDEPGGPDGPDDPGDPGEPPPPQDDPRGVIERTLEGILGGGPEGAASAPVRRGPPGRRRVAA